MAGYLMRLGQRVLAPQTLPRAAMIQGAAHSAREQPLELEGVHTEGAAPVRTPQRNTAAERSVVSNPRVSDAIRSPPRSSAQSARSAVGSPPSTNEARTERPAPSLVDAITEPPGPLHVSPPRDAADVRTQAPDGVRLQVASESATAALPNAERGEAPRSVRSRRLPREPRTRPEEVATQHEVAVPQPTVHVSIGRIEIRQPQPAVPAPAPAQTAPAHRVSLDDYLRGNGRG